MKENLNQLTEIYSKKPIKTGGQYKLLASVGINSSSDQGQEDGVTILPDLATPLNGGPSAIYGTNTGVNTRSN